MALDKAIINMKYDKRMTEWNLNNGVLTKEELEKHLGQLPDLTTHIAPLVLEEETNGSAESH